MKEKLTCAAIGGCALLLFHLLPLYVVAQQKEIDINFSVEKTYLYTAGDVRGFSATINATFFLSRAVCVGAEYRWGYAMSRPHLGEQYLHESLNYIEPKLIMFPLIGLAEANIRRAFGGLHIAVGPSLMAGVVGSEPSWTSTIINGVEVARVSRLAVSHIVDLGYAVTLGYRYAFKRVYAGARIDFANFRDHDGYAGYGLSLGIRL